MDQYSAETGKGKQECLLDRQRVLDSRSVCGMDFFHQQRLHEAFWRGEGPSLILIPPARQELYDLNNYPARFHNPHAMWESEVRRAESSVGWPTDGIPTIRPNLGVIFIPAMAGMGYTLPDNAMPWPGEPLTREAISKIRSLDVSQSETMRLAAEFYTIHTASPRQDVAAYQPDTQGVFDIAHLLWGDGIFCDLADPDQEAWIDELFSISHELYVKATCHVKSVLGEPTTSMIHGHGTSQGVYLPSAGTRMAEDTATLLSPAMIERFILPSIEKAASPFGSAFVHYCGKHLNLFEQLCRCEAVCAIDLGNPETYETRWLMERCAESGTVLYSRLAAEPGEDWKTYVLRLAALVRDTGARVILRPLVFPQTRDDCAAMRELWHAGTAG